ncbi:redoxin domain-containing protein [Alteromonas sp. a30]|uniref:redoxin domain-containing protein n=1 Tax=Alteromonas sp. a30 TaxID=2730917 RepID=UPI00227EAF13|nr:redoxin domain-containing protein [Alteromonas sp. a30]MCY7296728.1 redoxin domain-containing protein [Alteromonas sp. a30]
MTTETTVTFPQLNQPAPDFNAKTTHGQKSLADYKGKWLVLFSHPADFTPVCTTEFIGFANASDTSAVRATFIIDPEGVLRAMVYYPMSNGRSVDEFVRLVEALQTSDTNHCATPENWKKGEEVIVPPPHTMEDANMREAEGYHCVDWYFCKKTL